MWPLLTGDDWSKTIFLSWGPKSRGFLGDDFEGSRVHNPLLWIFVAEFIVDVPCRLFLELARLGPGRG